MVVLHLGLSLVFVEPMKEANKRHEEQVESLDGEIRDFSGNWEFKDLGFKSHQEIKHVCHILLRQFFAFPSVFAHFFFKTLEDLFVLSIRPFTLF